MTIILMFVGLLVLVMLNVPIAVALGVVAATAMVLTTGPDILPNVALVMYDGSTKFPLLAIPLFILAGAIMNSSSISRRLIAFASALLGFVKGGLAMVNIGTSLFFAEISGSAVADVAALGSILIPAMKKKGYPGALAAAVTSSSATLAVIIPPSIPMILYAVMADASVVQLFVAGIVPGVVGGFMMMCVAYWFAVRYKLPVEEAFHLPRVWATFKDAAWAFLLPVIILGGIFGGIVTATEGAALAVFAALFIGGVIYRELDWPHLRGAMMEGGVQTSVVMLLVASSALVGVFLTEQQVLPLVNVVGIDPVHFGLIVTLNLGIGQQTPPVASVLITACSVAKANIWEVSKYNVYFVAVLLFILLLVTYIPIIPMGLVYLFYG